MKKTSTPDISMYLTSRDAESRHHRSHGQMPGPGVLALKNIMNYARSVTVVNTRSTGNILQIMN